MAYYTRLLTDETWVRVPQDLPKYYGGLVLIGNTPALQVGVRGSIPLPSTKHIWDYCQLGRRPGLELGGRKFESCIPDQNIRKRGRVAYGASLEN